MSKTYTSQLDFGVCACMSARVNVCIRASVRPSGFFQAIISTFMDKFQNDLVVLLVKQKFLWKHLFR